MQFIENKEELDAYIKRQKETIDKCEVCHKPLNGEPCARRLEYGLPTKTNKIIILCKECNYRFYLAEEDERQKIVALTSKYISSLRALLFDYGKEHNEIVSDSILNAVQTNRTGRRSDIDMLFKYPTFKKTDEYTGSMMKLLRDISNRVGTWDGRVCSVITKEKMEKLRSGKKEKERKDFEEDLPEKLDF